MVLIHRNSRVKTKLLIFSQSAQKLRGRCGYLRGTAQAAPLCPDFSSFVLPDNEKMSGCEVRQNTRREPCWSYGTAVCTSESTKDVGYSVRVVWRRSYFGGAWW